MQAPSSQFLLTGVLTRPLVTPSPVDVAGGVSTLVPTLTQYVAVWLEGLEGLVRSSTVEAYAARLERHVLPPLGSVGLTR